MKKQSQALVCLLMLDAGWIAYGLSQRRDMWPWIVGYWIILTVKNLVDWIGGRHG